jgi:predicted Zn-dependent protease
MRADASLPDLGGPSGTQLTDQQQQTFRNAFLRTLYQSHRVNTDPVLNQWLSSLGQQLAQYAQLPQRPVFLLINSPEINAFAGPGGIIGIHTGLIQAAERTDEVAAVLAHELAHLQQRHLLRRIEQGRYNNLATLATLMAAILIGQKDPQAGMAIIYSGQGLSTKNQLAFSRRHETEADAVGIQILADTGFDPLAMADFFDKLHQHSRTNSGPDMEILRTHPVSSHRLADALARAQKLTATASRKPFKEQLPFIKLRINPQPLASDSDNCTQYYRQLLHKRSSSPQHPCTRDNWLVALEQALVSPKPWRQLKTLHSRYPNNGAIALALADLAPSTETAIAALDSWQQFPPPLQVLMLRKLAQLHKNLGNTAASQLYAALAAKQQGHINKSQALSAQIDPDKLSAKQRLLLQTLVSKVKKGTKPPHPKQNFISSLNIAMTSPLKTLAFAGGLSNLMLQEQRLAQKLSS